MWKMFLPAWEFKNAYETAQMKITATGKCLIICAAKYINARKKLIVKEVCKVK